MDKTTITSEDDSKGVTFESLVGTGILSPEEEAGGVEMLFSEHSLALRDINRNPTLNVPSKPYKITKLNNKDKS